MGVVTVDKTINERRTARTCEVAGTGDSLAEPGADPLQPGAGFDCRAEPGPASADRSRDQHGDGKVSIRTDRFRVGLSSRKQYSLIQKGKRMVKIQL